MQVSFVCQRCSQPLKLDTSFKILDRVTIQELTGQQDPWEEGGQEGGKWATLGSSVLWWQSLVFGFLSRDLSVLTLSPEQRNIHI